MTVRVFRTTALPVIGAACLINVALATGLQLLLSSVASWPTAGFGVSHSYYVVLALATALGVISSTWLSLQRFVSPFMSSYNCLFRSWPLQARRRVLSRVGQQVLLLSVPTVAAVLASFGVLLMVDPASAPPIAALGVGLGASVLVACGTWCSLMVGIRTGRPAVALFCAMCIGLFLPNGFANSVHEFAGIVLCSIVACSLVITGLFTIVFCHWLKTPEALK